MTASATLHHRFWPRAVPHSLRVPQVTLPHFLDVAAQRYPDKAAIVFGGQPLTYGRLRARVDALAGALQQRLGVRHGDRVLLVSQNCPQFTLAALAILRAGAVVVPINPMSTEPELRHYAADSGARVALAAQELLEPVLACLAGPNALLDALVVHAYSDALDPQAAAAEPGLPPTVLAPRAALPPGPVHGLEDLIALGLAPEPVPAGPDDLALLPYTSGTTGRPKGCMHTHRTVLASNFGSQLWRGLHADGVFLCVAPLFHMLGLQNALTLPLTLGATVVMLPRWNAAAAIRLIERYRVTTWAAPPAMVIDCFAQPEALQHDLSSLALLSGGGAAMPEAVAAMLAERFGLHYNEAYGLTETAAFLHANPVGRGKRQCLGIPTPGVVSRIVDPVTLADLPQGEVGELVSSGDQVMTGYWRNPEADAQAFFERDGRRYFRTGDLACMDEEGYYFLRDRLKRMINVSGFKVWPAELESALYEHPAIHEACVIGLLDAQQGESVMALVALKAGASATPQDIISWSRTRMAAYKVPRTVEILPALPKSATGKIPWRELQDQYRAAQSGAAQGAH